jgi:DNA repair exonuclease SbcCD ATPase subunit
VKTELFKFKELFSEGLKQAEIKHISEIEKLNQKLENANKEEIEKLKLENKRLNQLVFDVEKKNIENKFLLDLNSMEKRHQEEMNKLSTKVKNLETENYNLNKKLENSEAKHREEINNLEKGIDNKIKDNADKQKGELTSAKNNLEAEIKDCSSCVLDTFESVSSVKLVSSIIQMRLKNVENDIIYSMNFHCTVCDKRIPGFKL